MSILVTAKALDLRVGLARNGDIAALADSLARDLEPLSALDFDVPADKALLSRRGGRCDVHGAMLEFDALSPHRHRCPTGGEYHEGELHDRYWLYGYHLWLAERAVHAATLHALGNTSGPWRAVAERIIRTYAAQYLAYPNVDNVLGPSGPFFSTYLESIWLLQLSIALDLLEMNDADATRALGATARDLLIAPSAARIAGFDEGMSNRQVWNNAAMIAAARLLDRPRDVDSAFFGASGVRAHLNQALLSDGSWYEGENYHLFAHRGLWYAMMMARTAAVDVPARLRARYREGFAVPFLTALPDFTFPARRDSQYCVSLRQWRIAESCELGLAEHEHPRLRSALATLYDGSQPRRDTGRANSTAEAERNYPAAALDRSCLGWRSLLFAHAHLQVSGAEAPASILLGAQGLAIFRRNDGNAYAALDYGHSGGGHGHPDRLNLLLSDSDRRWFDDMGTGSYVDPSLVWYRSSLAHNAPMPPGQSQQTTSGELVAYDEKLKNGWAVAIAQIAPGLRVARTLVVTPDYIIDVINSSSAIDLPLHIDAEFVSPSLRFRPAVFDRDTMSDPAFSFLESVERADQVPDEWLAVRAESGGHVLHGWMALGLDVEIWRARAPGPPGGEPQRFLYVRLRSAASGIRLVWCWTGAIETVTGTGRTTVRLHTGDTHEHVRDGLSWVTNSYGPSGESTVELRGAQKGHAHTKYPDATDRGDKHKLLRAIFGPPLEPDASDLIEAQRGDGASDLQTLRRGETRRFELGERNYRRSEQTWTEAGRPTADVALTWQPDALRISVDVRGVERTFVPPGTDNPYDNEAADINGAGLQVYIGLASMPIEGWILVPLADSDAVTVRQITPRSDASPIVAAGWRATATGYAIDTVVSPPNALRHEHIIHVIVVVNEKPAGRARRRGQLALGGGSGQFVYLRGDREPLNGGFSFDLIDV